jgi:hypothetical protein
MHVWVKRAGWQQLIQRSKLAGGTTVYGDLESFTRVTYRVDHKYLKVGGLKIRLPVRCLPAVPVTL